MQHEQRDRLKIFTNHREEEDRKKASPITVHLSLTH